MGIIYVYLDQIQQVGSEAVLGPHNTSRSTKIKENKKNDKPCDGGGDGGATAED